jgi:hypothetical protein
MKRKFLSGFESTILLMILVSLACVLSAIGQQAPPQAAFRFANASAIPGKVLFTNDGRRLRPDGFGPGEYTSAIGTPSGSHRLAASADGTKSAETTFMLQANTATTIIAFAKPVQDPVTHKTIEQLQLFSQADPAREKGKHFYLLYVSARPAVDVVVNGQPRNLAALRQLKIDEIARGTIKVESAGKPVLEFAAQQNGNFLAMIFDKPDGGIAGMLLPDYD